MSDPVWKNFGVERFKQHVLDNPGEDWTAEAVEKWERLIKDEPFPYPIHAEESEDAPAGIPEAPVASRQVDTGAPSGEDPEQPPAILSAAQQRLRSMIAQAGDGPVVTDQIELAKRLRMVIPQIIRDRYPGRGYRWIDVARFDQERVASGGIWEAVNRTNHPRVPYELFDDATGGIVYAGQSLLCFTRREIPETQQREIEREFNLTVDREVENLEKSYGQGKRPIRLERIDDPGEGYGVSKGDVPHPLVPDSVGAGQYYDHGDTGAP